jgi:ribulose 1,5-bisphosphate synthetase/thiazole synthase
MKTYKAGRIRLLAELGLAFAFVVGTTANAQTTSQARVDPDVIIVGAGISGLAAALESARGGLNVTVVDMWSIFGGHAVMSTGGHR